MCTRGTNHRAAVGHVSQVITIISSFKSWLRAECESVSNVSLWTFLSKATKEHNSSCSQTHSLSPLFPQQKQTTFEQKLYNHLYVFWFKWCSRRLNGDFFIQFSRYPILFLIAIIKIQSRKWKDNMHKSWKALSKPSASFPNKQKHPFVCDCRNTSPHPPKVVQAYEFQVIHHVGPALCYQLALPAVDSLEEPLKALHAILREQWGVQL